jgi:hypothetical protein
VGVRLGLKDVVVLEVRGFEACILPSPLDSVAGSPSPLRR